MKIRFRNFTCIKLIGLAIISMCWGCAGFEQKIDTWQAAMRQKLSTKPSDAADNDADGGTGRKTYFIHTSRWSWETLDYVAEWYTGDAGNSKKLSEINPDLNPQKIAVGSEVVIPVSLLTTREPLPQNFIGESHPDFYKHSVRWPGESLSLIASWYTGASKNWRQLAKSNPHLNPNQIKSGNVVMIPTSLLKTRVPLPQKAAAKYTSHYFAYTVKRDNEKLEDIAIRYTGNSANRKLLAKANPDLNPNHLIKGNEVYIPQELLKMQGSIPASESSPAVSKPAAKSPEVENKDKPGEDEKIKLFGPKQFPKS